MVRSFLCAAAVLCGLANPSLAACGGSFSSFLKALKAEAVQKGHEPKVVERYFRGVQKDEKVLRADRRQGVFKRTFTDFARLLISQDRMRRGARNNSRYSALFDQIEASYGVPRGVLLAFWALETDYGAVQGSFNTRNALVTLAHDCRRPELFRPQIFAALSLFARGDLDPNETGAWAGEIGQVQMLPKDILENGVDGDGDGHVRLKTSAPDALSSGAQLLSSLGWRPRQPWLQEVSVPAEMDWSKAGLSWEVSVDAWRKAGVRAKSGEFQGSGPAALILPQGRLGPAFLAYENFDVFFEWNQSFVYVTTAAYFATRLSGAPVFDPRAPEPGLNDTQMRRLQEQLTQLGHDVGKIDGILGAKTRAAVRTEQLRLNLPADAWPTADLLSRL